MLTGLCALVLLGTGPLVGCGAEPAPAGEVPAPTSSLPAGVSPSPVTVPRDGLLLRSLGLANGPVDALSLPRTTVVTSVVDTPAGVSVVITVPTAAEVYDYLERELPGAGFTVTAESSATRTLTFAGRGWTGSLTGGPRACGLLLRPA